MKKINREKEKKEIIIKWGEGHLLQCDICFEMTRRNYRSEDKYWSDFFANSLRPIKFKMIKGWGKDKGKEIKYASN